MQIPACFISTHRQSFKYFPKKIVATAEAIEFDAKKNAWKKTTGFAPKPWVRTMEPPFDLDKLPLSLYELTDVQMNKWLGLNQEFVKLIRQVLSLDKPSNADGMEENLAKRGDSHTVEKVRNSWLGWYQDRLYPLLQKGEDGGVTLKR